MTTTKISITGQSREFVNQADARAWAKRLLDAEVIFMEIKEVNDASTD